MGNINNINRRKFLEYFGACTCGLAFTSCATAPITKRRQFKIIPESTLNRQAAQIYENVKKKAKLSTNNKQLDEIKLIGSKIENSVSAYFDTVNNILSMKVDMIVIRHPSPGAPIQLSDKISASIINAGDGAHEHPTQALLDSYSIRERLGEVRGKNILIVGDIKHSRVALSNIYALQLQGANVMVCGPKTLIPKYLHKLGVKVEYDLMKALRWCDVVNMLRLQNERMKSSYFPSVREYIKFFGLTMDHLNLLDNEIVVMHPGPINRGVEISSDVADSKYSIILDQVENGVAVRMAIIYLLAKKNTFKIQ